MTQDIHLSTRARRSAVAAVCGLLLTGGASAVVTVTVLPTTTVVSVGQSFSLDLTANGATAGIGAWDFVLALSQPGRVSLTGVTFSNALGIVGSEALSFTGSDFGVVSLLSSAELLQRQQSQPFRLATLTFNAVSAGTTGVSVVAPQFGQMLADAAGLAVVPTVLSGSVTVVPEPGTLVLLLSGAGVLAAWSKRADAGRSRDTR